jgi:hypothetical protein
MATESDGQLKSDAVQIDVTRRELALPDASDSKASSAAEWQPPSPYDVVKELNNQIGRIAGMLTLFFVLLTFIITNSSEVHDAVTKWQGHWATICSILGMFSALTFAVAGIVTGLQPTVASRIEDKSRWEHLLQRKTKACRWATWSVVLFLAEVTMLWLSALIQPSPRDLSDLILAAVSVVLVFLAVFAAIRPRGGAGYDL